MSGIVVYSEYEAKRNEFAVSKFKKYLGAELVLAEHLDVCSKPDFVINRTNNAKTAAEFEKIGVRVFNPSPLTALANNKQACYEFMQSNGIEIMPVNQTAAPVVEKPVNGKGGQGVRLIKSGEFKIKPGFVYQKPASDLGRDLRVWLIGGEIICAVLRKSDELSASEQALVLKIASLLKFDYIGIDFVFNEGKIVFNEIEDSVGARMVYEKTDIDILRLYCDYIKKEMN